MTIFITIPKRVSKLDIGERARLQMIGHKGKFVPCFRALGDRKSLMPASWWSPMILGFSFGFRR